MSIIFVHKVLPYRMNTIYNTRQFVSTPRGIGQTSNQKKLYFYSEYDQRKFLFHIIQETLTLYCNRKQCVLCNNNTIFGRYCSVYLYLSSL